MESEVHYKRVGIFIVTSLAISVFIFLLLSHTLSTESQKRYLIFFEKQSLDGLQKDSAVTMKGIKIGTVEDYAISEENIQRVKVTILIDTAAPIKTDSRAVLKRNFLTGIAKIDIVGGTQRSETLSSNNSGELPIIQEELTGFEKIADSFPLLLSQTQEAISRINLLLSDKNITTIHDTLNSMRSMSSDLAETGPEIKKTVQSLRAITEETKKILEQLNANEKDTIGNDIRRIITQLEITSKHISEASSQLDPLATQTQRSLLSIEHSLKNISQDFKSFSEGYANPQLLIQRPQSNE